VTLARARWPCPTRSCPCAFNTQASHARFTFSISPHFAKDEVLRLVLLIRRVCLRHLQHGREPRRHREHAVPQSFAFSPRIINSVDSLLLLSSHSLGRPRCHHVCAKRNSHVAVVPVNVSTKMAHSDDDAARLNGKQLRRAVRESLCQTFDELHRETRRLCNEISARIEACQADDATLRPNPRRRRRRRKS
jgi:hypothetical protein